MSISNLFVPVPNAAFSSIVNSPGVHDAVTVASTASSAGGATDARPIEGSEARAAADAEVAKSYATILEAGSYNTYGRPPYVHVPPASTLGQWRVQLKSAFNDAAFVAWAKEQRLDTRNLILNPERGELMGYVDGSYKTFTLSDDSGWFDISHTLLSVARLFAPEPGQEVGYPLSGRDDEVTFDLVARFYGDPAKPTPAQASARREALRQNSRLELPDSYAAARSDAALSAHQEALGDAANHHALITALGSQVDDANGKIDLENVKISIDPRSKLFATEQRKQMTVAQYLTLEGNKVPGNSEQAVGFAQALSVDLAHRAPGVNSGGAKPMVGLLGATALRKMGTFVQQWLQSVHQPSEMHASRGTGSLLNRLIGSLPEATRKAITDNPSLALDQILRSPEALELGKAIEKRVKLPETPTSAIESVSAALVQELDPGVGKSKFNLAGYNLYGQDNIGASSAEIVKRFTAHLAGKVGAEAAPIAARLLLSAAAPEFLVKDVPADLVFGSHTWTSFETMVARIEKRVPGSPANMPYSQVLVFGTAPPVSLEEEEELNAAARQPIITWGVANGVIQARPDRLYTDAEFEDAKKALSKQQKELAWAGSVLTAPVKTRRELALAELKKVFPDVDPTLEVMMSTSLNHTPMSLLDIYMSGPIIAHKWKSMDESKFPYASMTSRLSELEPDIGKQFDREFEMYKKTHEVAWAVMFKYRLSLMPAVDKEFMKSSDISFLEVFRRTKPELEIEWTPLPTNVRLKNTTEEEREKRRGKYGVLMKVENNDGQVNAYSYFPASGKIVKEAGYPDNMDDSAYFNGLTEGREPDKPNFYKQFGATNTDRDPPGSINNIDDTYSSERSGALGATVSQFFARDYEALKREAMGVTALEEGRAVDEKLKNFLLSLVPFYDGVDDALKGNVGGAVFNIGFDLLGFIIPGANAARKAAKHGKNLFKVIKAGAFAGVGASVGFTDTVDITKNLNKAAGAGYKDIKYIAAHADELLERVKGNYKKYDQAKTYKEGDVVKGFLRWPEENIWRPTVAIFKKSGWYAYNVTTKTPFGVQAAQFGVVSALTP